MKKKNLKSLELNKKSISNLENKKGGKAASDCTSQLSCYTTSCITDTFPFPIPF